MKTSAVLCRLEYVALNSHAVLGLMFPSVLPFGLHRDAPFLSPFMLGHEASSATSGLGEVRRVLVGRLLEVKLSVKLF